MKKCTLSKKASVPKVINKSFLNDASHRDGCVCSPNRTKSAYYPARLNKKCCFWVVFGCNNVSSGWQMRNTSNLASWLCNAWVIDHYSLTVLAFAPLPQWDLMMRTAQINFRDRSICARTRCEVTDDADDMSTRRVQLLLQQSQFQNKLFFLCLFHNKKSSCVVCLF